MDRQAHVVPTLYANARTIHLEEHTRMTATEAGRKIREFAEKNGLTLAEIAREAGIRADHLDKILRGARSPSPDVRQKLSAVVTDIQDDWTIPPTDEKKSKKK